jgi:hypothetical protein
MPLAALALSLLSATLAAAGPQHFTLAAAFDAPRKPGANGAVAVTFTPLDPDVHVNETPAPRIKLGASDVLVDKQPPASEKLEPYDPDTAAYLDLALPVYFPVAIAKGAAKGAHEVPVSVTYFYCSKRAGWCRKGTSELSVPVNVP